MRYASVSPRLLKTSLNPNRRPHSLSPMSRRTYVLILEQNSPDPSYYQRKTPRVRWCESGDHLLASGGGIRSIWEITCWHQASESSAFGVRFLRMPASDLLTRTTRRVGVFLLYRTYLWNKQQVMSINFTTWSTMQYHVVVDDVAFYVIHSQVRYNSCCLPPGALQLKRTNWCIL